MALAALTMLLPSPAGAAPAPNPTTTWQPNGQVNIIEASPDGGTAYIGGSFSYVGPSTGHATQVSSTGGTLSFPRFTGGAVNAIVPDTSGSGGWFVGGSFTKVNGIDRRHLVRVRSDGRLDLTWTLQPDVEVSALHAAPTRLFIGFKSATAFGSLSAVNLATRAIDTTWDGSVPVGEVRALAWDNSTDKLLVGGTNLTFDGISGGGRLLGRVAGGTGDPSFMPTFSSAAGDVVNDIEVTVGGVAYVGGRFTSPRTNIAAYDNTGTLLAFTPPTLNNTVNALALSGTTLYVGGLFTFVNGGTARKGAAAIDTSNNGLTSWDPLLNLASVFDVKVSAGQVYLAGGFSSAGASSQRHGIVRVSASDATVDSAFAPTADGSVVRSVAVGSTVAFGGDLWSTGGYYRNRLAAIDLFGGAATSWNPITSSYGTVSISAIATYGDLVFVGGTFASTPRMLAFSADDDTAALTNKPYGGPVTALAVTTINPHLFVGGQFSERLDAFRITGPTSIADDTATISVAALNDPAVGAPINAMTTSGNRLYIAGGMYGGGVRYTVGATVSANWAPDWFANLDGDANDVAVSLDGAVAYFAGAFVAGAIRARNTTGSTGTEYAGFSPATYGSNLVSDLAVSGQSLATSGMFAGKLSVLDTVAGTLQWAPASFPARMTGSVEDVDLATGRVLAAGQYGIAVYEGDQITPHVNVSKIDEAAPNSSSDGVHVTGTTVWVRPTPGATRQFSVRARAFDRVSGDDATYTGVSGLAQVDWPALPTALGPWAGNNDVSEGASRGARVWCWNDDTPTDEANAGLGITRNIDFAVADDPNGFLVKVASHYGNPLFPVADDETDGGATKKLMSCRWRGYIVGLLDDTSARVRTIADNDFKLAGINDGSVPTTWNVLDYQYGGANPDTTASDVSFAEPQPFTAQWFEASGQASARLLWDARTPGTFAAIPTGSYVTDVFYDQQYSVTFGPSALATVTPQTQVIAAADRAGNTATPATFSVGLDATLPDAPAGFTVTPSNWLGAWTNTPTVDVSLMEQPDVGSGLDTRQLQVLHAPTSNCTDAGSVLGWQNVGAPITGTAIGVRTWTGVSIGTGCYKFRYQMTDNVGNTSWGYPNASSGGTLFMRNDTIAPTGGSFGYTNGAINTAEVTITGTPPTDADSGMQPVSLWRRSADYAAGTCTNWTAFSFLTNGIANDASVMDGSCYMYELRTQDAAGNVGPTFTPTSIAKVDTGRPVPSFTQAPTYAMSTGTATLSGFLTDSVSGPSTITLSWTGPGGTSGTACLAEPVDSGTGAWMCTFAVPGIDGDYTFSLTGTDVAGNVPLAPATLAARVDNVDPAVTLTHAPASGTTEQYWDTTSTTPKLWYKPTTSTNQADFDLTATIVDDSTATTTFPDLSPGWTLGTRVGTTQRYTRTSTPLTGGFTVDVVDASGNETLQPFDVAPDSSAPTITGSISYSGGYQAEGTSISVSAGTVDDTGTSGVRSMVIVREHGTLLSDGCTYVGYTPIAATNVAFDTVPSGNAACYRYRFDVLDNVGNSASDTGAWIKVDNAPPTLDVTTAPPTDTATNVLISGTVSDVETAGKEVVITVEDMATSAVTTVCSDGTIVPTFSCEWNVSTYLDGDYTIHVNATDNALNPATPQSYPVTLDRMAPTLDVQLSPSVGSAASVHVDNLLATPHAWVRGDVTGGIVVDTQVTSGASGADVTMPDLGSTFSFPPVAPAGGPATAYEYTWTPTPSDPSPATSTVMAESGTGIQAFDDFQVEVDADAPANGWIDTPNQLGGTASITFDEGDDGSSGVETWQLQRRGSLTDTTTGACLASWGGWGDIGPAQPSSPYVDNTVERDRCYQYQLVVDDFVGHSVTYVDANASDAFTADTVGVVITPGAVTNAVEGGATASFEVKLRAQPTSGTVTISLTSSSEVSLTHDPLVFDSTNWYQPVPVTVTATDDDYDEVPATATETIGWSADATTDTEYDTLAPGSYQLQVTDDDTPGFTVTPTSSFSVAEGGAGATYGIVLTSRPQAGTEVRLTPTYPSQVSGPSADLVFDTTNWNDPHLVTVTAVDDALIEASITGSITYTLGGTAYTGVTTPTLTATVTDNDAAALVVSGGGGTVSEAATTTTDAIRVRLSAQPAQTVRVSAAALGGQVSLSPAYHDIAPANWNTDVTFTVAAIEDTVAEPNPHVARVSISSTSGDPNFNALPEQVVTENVTDNDTPGLSSVFDASWVFDDQQRLLLDEATEKQAKVKLTVIGDPTSELTLTFEATPADEVVFQPASVTVPAGSHAYSFDLTVHAVNDQVAEPDPHTVTLQAKVATSDPVWGAVTFPPTTALITDGAEPVLREEDPPPTDDGDTGGGGGDTTNDSGSDQTGDTGGDQTTVIPYVPPAETTDATQETPTDAAPDDEGEEEIDPGPTLGSEKETAEPARRDEDDGNVITRPARKVAEWAKDNPIAASVGASAAGTAAVWAAGAKPLALAGKALGTGGFHIPGTPDGLDQARDLLRRKKNGGWRERLMRIWRKKRELEDELDLDLDDFDDWDHRAA